MEKIGNKMVGRIIICLIFCTNVVFGAAFSSVDKNEFELGEEVSITIEATGDEIVFPQISNIAIFGVQKSSKSTQAIVSNGKNLKNIKMSYTINPTISFVVPEFIVKIDGVNFKTVPIAVAKKSLQVSSKNDDLDLRLEIAKEKLYVGEPVLASLIFGHKKDLNIVKSELKPLKIENFKIYEQNGTKVTEIENRKIERYDFLLVPEKSGNYEIENQLINVVHKDSRNYFTIRKKIYSQNKFLEVLPLPNGVKLLGDFSLKVDVERFEVESNKPVNLTIQIDGFGNINEIEPFYFELKNVMSHISKPQITSSIKDGKFYGKFVQKISLVAENDFEIAPFELKFFNPNTNNVETIASKPLKIRIIAPDKELENIQIAQTPQIITLEETSVAKKFLFVAFGMIFGIVLNYVLLKFKKIRQKIPQFPIVLQIKKAKSDKQLYDLLLPYASNEDVTKFIQTLEQNIYFGAKHKIDKNQLCEILSLK